MKKILAYFTSGAYSFFQITLGFLVHPYQTMQQLVKDKYLVFLTLIPTFILLILVILWNFAVYPIFSYFNFAGGYFTELIKFSVLFFCLLWQISLGYLFGKFWLLIRI